MIVNIEGLMHEWFANLPKGYAQKPYSRDELLVLENVLRKHKLDPAPFITALTEADVDKDGKPDDSKDDRFIADSQPWMETLDAFEKFIFDNYVMAGQQLDNLDVLYRKLIDTPDPARKNIIKIIGKNTKRKLSGSSYKMGQYEKMLFDLIKGSVKVPNGHHSELWFAIIHDGEIKGGVAGESGIVSDVDVDTDGVSLKNYSKMNAVDFGSLDPDLSREFSGMVSLLSILTDSKVTKSLGRSGINKLLEILETDEIQQDFNALIQLGQNSKIGMINRIFKRVEKILRGRSPEEMVVSFCEHVDDMLRTKLTEVDWWGIIVGDMVHLSPSQEIFDALKCQDNRLSDGVLNFHKLSLWINANKIHKEIID